MRLFRDPNDPYFNLVQQYKKELLYGWEICDLPFPSEYIAQPEDVILIYVGHPDRSGNVRPGLELLNELRIHGVGALSVVYSFETKEILSEIYPVIGTRGVTFFRLPLGSLNFFESWHPEDACSRVEIEDVVRWQIMPRKWRQIEHDILRPGINKGFPSDRIIEELRKFIASLKRHAPDLSEQVNGFADLVEAYSKGDAYGETVRARLRSLINALLGNSPVIETSGSARAVADQLVKNRKPPKGFRSVLVADDSNVRYKGDLTSEYRYTVIGHARHASEAREIVKSGEPKVILADFFYRESENQRANDDDAGKAFIRWAQTAEYETVDERKAPMVVVVSAAALTDQEIEALSNKRTTFCLGEDSKTAREIHEAICEKAAELGVTESEDLPDIRVELRARQRVNDYSKDFSESIDDWKQAIPKSVRQTLNRCHALRRAAKATTATEKQLLNKFILLFTEYLEINCPSLNQGIAFSLRLEALHNELRDLPLSPFVKDLKQTLHAAVKQVSGIVFTISHRIDALTAVVKELTGIEGFGEISESMDTILKRRWQRKPLIPVLKPLRSKVVEPLLAALPELPNVTTEPDDGENPEIIRIVVVEDTAIWQRVAGNAVTQLKKQLEARYLIKYEPCSNAAEALKIITSRSKTSVISNRRDRIIAVVDMCIPKDAGDAAKIERSGETGKIFATASPENGFGIIEKLSSYEYNCQALVYTDVDGLPDRRRLFELGIDESRFVSKSLRPHGVQRVLAHRLESAIRESEVADLLVISATKAGKRVYLYEMNGIHFEPSRGQKNLFEILLAHPEAKGADAEQLGLGLGKSKKALHNAITGLRKTILERMRSNGVYCDVHRLLETKRKNGFEPEFAYELNVRRQDTKLKTYNSKREKVPTLLMFDKAEAREGMQYWLECLGWKVNVVKTVEEGCRQLATYEPSVVCIFSKSLSEGFQIWQGLKNSFRKKCGLLFINEEQSDTTDSSRRIVTDFLLEGIRLRCIMEKRHRWLNLGIQRAFEEYERIILNKRPRPSTEYGFPIIEILEGSDLETGLLKLRVDNGLEHSVNRSDITTVLIHLLNTPRKIVSYSGLMKKIKGRDFRDAKERNNWCKGVRLKLRDLLRHPTKRRPAWIDQAFISVERTDEIAESIIAEQGTEYLQLNAFVVDRRKG